jgi:hypothetical protein
MTTTDLSTELRDLGDALQCAARRDVRRPRRARRIATGTIVLCVGLGATAVATGVFSSDDVASGMPAGAAMFGGTHPTCTGPDSSGTFDCHLTSKPTEEILDDYTGTKEPLAIDHKVAGGCIGQDHAGMRWTCYLGQAAVTHGIVSQGFLGETVMGPGRG